MKLIIVENLQKLKMLFNVDCSSVKTVVLMNSKPDEEIPTKEGIKVVQWAEALKAEGVLNEARPTPDNLGTFELILSPFQRSCELIFSHFELYLRYNG